MSDIMQTAPSKGVPAFLSKLMSMLEDVQAHPYIAWGPCGDTVLVKDQSEFSRVVLPQYFKHNNFASFVRQLNLYGFSKCADSDKNEFSNKYFRQGKKDLLLQIKRKSSDKAGSGISGGGQVAIHGSEVIDKTQLDSLCGEIRMLKARTDHMERQLSLAGKENEILWTEVAQAKERQELLQRRMSKIIIFLAKTFGSGGGLAVKDDSGKRRRVEGGEEGVTATAEHLLRGDSDENLVQFLIDITGSDLKASDLERSAGNTGSVTPAAPPPDLFSRRGEFTLPPILAQQFPFQTASPGFPIMQSVTSIPTAVASSRYNWAAVPDSSNSSFDESNIEQCQQGVLRRLMEFQNTLEIDEAPFQ